MKSNSQRLRDTVRALSISALGFVLVACGGGTDVNSSTNKYPIGGTIRGLAIGQSITLEDASGAKLTVGSNGKYTLVSLPNTTTYNIRVASQPSGQICKISKAGGDVRHWGISDVDVFCSNVLHLLAGTVTGAGNADGQVDEAAFYDPGPLTVDVDGNLYLTDGNKFVRKISTNGVVSTLGDGTGFSNDSNKDRTKFASPQGIAVDAEKNLYLADTGVHIIRKISPLGVVTTLAGSIYEKGSGDGIGSASRFNSPAGLVIDPNKNLYVVDSKNATIRKITSAGVVSTLAGSPGSTGSADGFGTAARFSDPSGIAMDSNGNLYVSDTGNHTIRKITPGGAVTTLAGSPGNSGSVDGAGNTARFKSPKGLTIGSDNSVYVADYENNVIRKINSAGTVSTLAGTAGTWGHADGLGGVARFSRPQGVAFAVNGDLYVSDGENSVIRKVSSAGLVSTVAGSLPYPGTEDGVGGAARFKEPKGLAVDADENVYVADTFNHTIRKITPNGQVSTLAGSPGNSGNTDGVGTAVRFSSPQGLAVGSDKRVYVANGRTIRVISPLGVVSTLAGDALKSGASNGYGTSAQFGDARRVAVDANHNVYVADYDNHAIRKITPAGLVSTFAGSLGNSGMTDGTGTEARFKGPTSVAVDSDGYVYVVDSENKAIRKITPDGVVSTLAGKIHQMSELVDGTGTNATFRSPLHIAVDPDKNVYVTEYALETVRKITPSGVVTTVMHSVETVGAAPVLVVYYGRSAIAASGNKLYLTDKNGVVWAQKP